MPGKYLLNELASNPVFFNREGHAYDLLQEFFNGFDLDELRPFLMNKDLLIVREALWIVSELGDKSSNFIGELTKAMDIKDKKIQYLALEGIANGAVLSYSKYYYVILENIYSNFKDIRRLCMQLISNAKMDQLQSSINVIKNDNVHKKEITEFVKTILGYESLSLTGISNMMLDNNALVRKCGAIISKKIVTSHPELIINQMDSNDDDIKYFAEWVKEIYID